MASSSFLTSERIQILLWKIWINIQLDFINVESHPCGQMYKSANRHNILLTESTAITKKYQTGILIVRTEHSRLGPYLQDSGLILSSDDQADVLNKRFIIWLALDKQNIMIKLYCMRIAWKRVNGQALLKTQSQRKVNFLWILKQKPII